MQVTDKIRETGGETDEIILTIEASAEEVNAKMKEFFAELNEREYTGFRKGKAPRPVIEQSLGGHANAMGGVAEKLINEMAWQAIDSQDVIFMGEPLFNVTSTLEENKPFSFSVAGVVKPELELTSTDPVTIQMPPDEATDSEVEKQIQLLREYHYTLQTVEGRAAENGDFVTVLLSLELENGVPVKGFTDAKRMIEMGGSTMPAEFTDALLGAKAGEQHTFTFDTEGKDGYAHLGNGVVKATAEVVDVRVKILPELDDEFAIKHGAMDVEDLRKSVRISINAQKNEQLPAIMEERCLAEAAKRAVGEVPEYYLTFVREQVQHEVMDKMQQDENSLQDFILNQGIAADDFKENIKAQAIDRAVRDLTLDALFRANCKPVEDEEIKAQFGGAQDGDEDMVEKWRDAGHLSNLREVVARAKALQWLVATAEVEVVE